MRIFAGTPSVLGRVRLNQIRAYRHRVFVETLGWNLIATDGLEFDQFDRADTVHMAALTTSGRIIGVARLLPTTRPYLLRDVFPQLLGSTAAPASPQVWELSRFAAIDVDAPERLPTRGLFSSPVAVGLLTAALGAARSLGASRLITVSPLGVERLLRRAGFVAQRLASPVRVDGQPVFACSIDCSLPADSPHARRNAKTPVSIPRIAARHRPIIETSAA